MQVIFHLGAHCTDQGLLIRSVLRNRTRLEEESILVPGPARYKELLSQTSTKLRGANADATTEDDILQTLCAGKKGERLVLANENFICRADVAVDGAGLYTKANKTAWLRNCLPSHDVEFALGIRNPAVFLPDLVRRTKGKIALQHVHLGTLLWSDVIKAIKKFNPETPLIVWCHEDTPFIWPELMSELTAHDPNTTLEGGYDMLETIVSDTTMAGLLDHLENTEISSELDRRRAISRFLEEQQVEDAVQEEISLPDWTESTIDVLSEIYEQDLEEIARIPGVTFITA